MENDKWTLWATRANQWRIIPRLLIAMYGYMCYEAAMWFMGIPSPTGPQVAFVSTIWGGGAAWFGFYVNSGSGGKKKEN